MTAALAYEVPTHPVDLVAAVRSLGPLRVVDPYQAPVVRAAALLDRRLLPKWQRFGTGVHHTVPQAHYAQGRHWVRLKTPTGELDVHSRTVKVYRQMVETGTPHVNWRTRDHWLNVVVPTALLARPEARQLTATTSVSVATFRLWAQTISGYAHVRTGRGVIVRPDKLAALMEVSERTVQRCQEIAERLGLYVVMLPGRMLHQNEQSEARLGGSYQRGFANDSSLVIPDWMDREVVDKPLRGRPRKRRSVTPPTEVPTVPIKLTVGSSLAPAQRSARDTEPTSSARRQEKRGSPPPQPSPSPAHRHSQALHRAPGEPRGRVYDQRALELARSLVEALPWLRGTAPGRIELVLRRFANARRAWRACDLIAAFDLVNRRLGRAAMTRDLVKHAPGYLAHCLNDLDVDADHPRLDLDPDDVRAPTVSQVAANNLVLLAHARERRSQGLSLAQSADTRAAVVARIRCELNQPIPPASANPQNDDY